MNTGGTTPTPELLAAYADGELHGAERAAVEVWLDGCPQARAEVEALRRLACQCRRTVAPDPSPDAWDAVLLNVHAALPSGPVHMPLPRRRPAWPAAIATAAAVFAGIFVGRTLWTVPAAPQATVVTPATLKEPISLADAREIDIVSIDDEDAASLLIGQPPIREKLQLAGPGDITVVGLEPFHGIAANLHDDGTPIIVPSAKDEP
jgi:hypothetical protein